MWYGLEILGQFLTFILAHFWIKVFFCQTVNHAYVSKSKIDPIFSIRNAVFRCKLQIEITFDTVMLWTWNFDSSLVWTRKRISKIFFLMTSYFHNGAPISKKLILTVLARCTASGLENIENLIGYCRKRILLAFRISKQNLKIYSSSGDIKLQKI